ncbi:MAG: glycosyltransferase [Phycisphaerae bacterium]
MLTVLLWISVGLWTLFFIQMVVNWVLVRDLRKLNAPSPEKWPFVSIVVPARDEERSVHRAVSSFCRQDYEGFEVIVVDDQSTDRTPQILHGLQSRYPNLTVITGTGPPDGWHGKPNALETGRRAAKGDWLLFVDADVVYAPGLLRRAIAYALEQDVGMLVLMPRFATGQVLETVMMSTLYLVVFACFPLFLVARSRNKWFAVGNGVFNLVRRDALQACGAFESLKGAVLDDVGLGYKVRQAGHGIAVGLAGPLVYIRMYHGTRELVRGFTKNAFPMSRNRPWLVAVPFLLGTILSLLPYIGLIAGMTHGFISIPAMIALILMHLVTVGLAIRFHQPWYVTFLNPLREVCWWGVLLRSFIAYHRHGIVWRGRRYHDKA